jgi:hypothetical protein
MRISHIVAVLLASVTSLIGQPGCKIEIAYVKDFKGSWKDEKYDHQLRINQSICEDSRITRIQDKNATPDDFLLLTDRRARELPRFQCKYLLGCEAPLDLSDIARETRRQLDQPSLETPRSSIRSTLTAPPPTPPSATSPVKLTADELTEYNRSLDEILGQVRTALQGIAKNRLNVQIFLPKMLSSAFDNY